MEKFIIDKIVSMGDPETVCDFLSYHSSLSKLLVKSAMQKGAVWMKPERGRHRRVRKAKSPLHFGDRVTLYYDAQILAFIPPVARCLFDFNYYSVWLKPMGLLSQGSAWGDHGALLRQAELFFTPRRHVYLVHRLDREASGIMLLAHSTQAAARLSNLFQRREVKKTYLVEVKGRPGGLEGKGLIDYPLDGRRAVTAYEVKAVDLDKYTSVVEIWIETGRKHQIRRHFDMIGCPVIGDPLYGSGNKDPGGLRLSAISLSFLCPFTSRPVHIDLDFADIPWFPSSANSVD